MDSRTLAINILQVAGYEVKIDKKGKTFCIYEEDKKIRGYSYMKPLRPTEMMTFIQEKSYQKGLIRGKRLAKEEIRSALGISK